jgi:CRISPR-associated protein Cas1
MAKARPAPGAGTERPHGDCRERQPPHRALPAVEVREYLPARMLNDFVYCPRLFFYQWVEGVFADSAGARLLRHEKVEGTGEALPPAGEARDEPIHSRTVSLASDTYKLVARIDMVEGAGGAVSPVDYKPEAPRDGDHGPEAWPADRAQLCAQALILRDNGYTCTEGIVYYNGTNQRVRVAIDNTLAEETLRAVTDARVVATSGRIPPPLVDSPKCPGCPLVRICLRNETAAAAAAQRVESAE